jgi:3-isopropylmalate dehydratase small subunit
VFGDNVDTDAIIPGDACHLATPEELGPHCFEYFRPDFRAKAANRHTIVVAGTAWGCGSSREHAVWALKGAGIRVILAKSIAFIHKRNLVNEGVPFITMKGAEGFYTKVQEGGYLMVEVNHGVVIHMPAGDEHQGTGLSGVAAEILDAGGIIPTARRLMK